jgi:hypothetical protein
MRKKSMASMFSRPPYGFGTFALFAAVVEVEHRRDRIHAKRVEVEFFEPVEGVRDQEISHFGSAVVEDQGSPIGMLAFAFVGVFVERRSIEATEREIVLRKVRRHPVDDDADPVLMAVVHEILEVVRGAVTRGGREVAGDLVTPRRVERVLGDGHQFDVREAEAFHVIDQTRGNLTIREGAISLFGNAHPRAEVELVDRNRQPRGILRRALLHESLIAPRILRASDACGARWRKLHFASKGVGLGAKGAFFGANLVLVEGPWSDSRNEQLPDPRAPERAHRQEPTVPAIEVADDADALRVRRPDGERRARRAVDGAHLRAERLPEPSVRPLTDEVHVELAQRRQEAIGVVALPGTAFVKVEAQAVRKWRPHVGQEHLEQPSTEGRHGHDGGGVSNELAARRIGMVRPHDDALVASAACRMRTQHRVWIVRFAAPERVEHARIPAWGSLIHQPTSYHKSTSE